MTVTEVLSQQFYDLFRWGLIAALVLTQGRTRAVTGTWLPLAAGVVFVAVIIPSAMTPALAPFPMQVGVGLGVNAVMVAVVLCLRLVWLRLNPPRP
jgi:hypothetical protein